MPPALTPSPLRVGIVGVGFGQNVLLPAFRSDARATVTALAASTEARAQAVAQRTGVPGAFGDWRALCDSPAVDVVAIAVPPVLQPAIAEAAIAQGKPIFCEKPVAMDVERARGLLSRATAAGVAHAIDFEFRALASWQRAKALLANGELGAIRGFSLDWHVLTRAQQLQTVSWRQRIDEGGGALSSFASHSLDLVEWLLGRIARVSARLHAAPGLADTRVAALLELADGAAGTLSVATDAVGGAGHRLEIHGTEATLLLENGTPDHFRNFVLSRSTRTGEKTIVFDERAGDPPDGPLPDGRIAPVSALVGRFIDAILTKGGPPVAPGLAEGVRVEELMQAIRTSDRSGAWTPV